MIIAKIVLLYLFIGLIVALILAVDEFSFFEGPIDMLICILLWTIAMPYALYLLVCMCVEWFKSRKKKNK